MTETGSTMTDAEMERWAEEMRRPGQAWRGPVERRHVAYEFAKGKRPKADAPVVNGCVHRWRIPEPDGNTYLTGVCQVCGASRQFYAAEPDWQAKAALVDNLGLNADPRRKDWI